MPYATQQDMIDRYGYDALAAVADLDGSGVINEDAVTAALTDAAAEIDSYVGAKYPLPLVSVPAPLVRSCIDMAMYGLAGGKATDDMQKRYERAVSWLKDVAKGLATLGDHPAEMAPSQASFTAGERQSTRTKLSGGF